MLPRQRHGVVALEEDGPAQPDRSGRGAPRPQPAAARRQRLRETCGAKGRYRRRAAWRIMLLTCMTPAPSGQPPRLARRRPARAGRAAQLPRSPDAGVDEVLGDAGHSRHRARGELGHDPGALQVGLRRLSPIGGYLADRYSRRHVIAGSLLVWSLVTWATGHVTTLRRAARDARADGHQRGVLHPGGAGADRRLPPRRDALARRRSPPDGDLRRRHRRRVRRLRGRPSRPRLALGLRRLRHRRHRSTPCRSSSCSANAAPVAAATRTTRGQRIHRAGPRARASCSATARSSCSCSTSRCRRWPAGSCATGCRRF